MGDYRIVLDTADEVPLSELARQIGYTWGSRGNVKAMVQAIAQGRLSVGESTAFTEEQRQALGRSAIAALERGEWQEAILLGKLIELNPSTDEKMLALVQARLEPLKKDWVKQIFTAIEEKQAFKLSYQDAAERPFQFTVCGAEFSPHERRTYLDCWCVETEDNQDVPKLQHNWSLRLDRIVEANIIPIKRKWRLLDSVEVEMQFSGGLAHAYEPRPDDVAIEWSDETKIVKRSIHNSFWLIREILRYGKDCKVVAPLEIYDRIRQQLAEALQRYA
jgi:predicted DNA-binding transcriptional regulator YafY